ncbi:microtubule-associated serine/threonine-protein kinase 4-like [Trichomycterus rosablanca]|uniref:microtubule-associated serine/threonine-protein kinase 4-like n=1 Tax=Trichomycterus rosablanca TaxID=2290929 RepID=UPI002F352036
MDREPAEEFGSQTSSSSETLSEGDSQSSNEETESELESAEVLRPRAISFTCFDRKVTEICEGDSEDDSDEEKMRNKWQNGRNGQKQNREEKEDEDETLDHILSPPFTPFSKMSNPELRSGSGQALKFTRQLSDEGRQLRRGSLGSALTGKYLLPYMLTQQSWPAARMDSSNLVRMRSQSFGKSAPSLTASLKCECD